MIYVWPTLAILLSLGLMGFSLVALYVDDWQRDLRERMASTDDDPRSPLAAYRTDQSPAELANHVVAVIGRLPRWRLERLEEGDGEVRLHLVRTTRWLRRKDDVRLRISPEGEGSILRAESQSRSALPDLGQNPRNLRELLGAIAEPVTRERNANR